MVYSVIKRRLPVLLALLFPLLAGAAWAAEETFETLKAGADTYTNVVVYNKTASRVFFKHEGGLASVKVKDLAEDDLKKLGYATAEPPKSPVLSLQVDALTKKMEDTKAGEWVRRLLDSSRDKLKSRNLNQGTVLIVLVCLALLFHLFYSFCLRRICLKLKTEPGSLIWLPFLQLIPLHRAAGISPWLIVLYLLLLPGVFVFIYLCVRICQAVGKSAWWVVLLFLPLLNLFLIPYLAFSQPGEDDEIVFRPV